MATEKIVDLRKLLAQRFPQTALPPADRLVTGLSCLDTILDGGLTKGAITEITSGPGSAGSATLMAALLHRICGERSFLALIDGRDSFDPQSLGAHALAHLFWVRCRAAKEAMQAADLLLRDGNFPLVILDLVLNPLAELRQIPSSHWYRLQRLVEPAPTAFLVLTPRSLVHSAQWKLVLQNRWRLAQLQVPAEMLPAHMQMRLARAQPNRSLARVG